MFSGKLFYSGFLIVILPVSLVSIISPTHSWVYQDGTPEDTKFEEFGPRTNRLFIKLNATAQTLENGEVDIVDFPVAGSLYDRWTNPPFNQTINVVGYGPEYGFFMLDINNNNNPYLGNPPDPSRPNPVYPNPCGVLSFRQAIAHLVDRAWLDIIIGLKFYVPIWMPMSPALGKYFLNIPNPYPYNPPLAATLLDLDGFPVNPATGWRFWDMNGNGIEEPIEYLELRFVIRSDHAHRRQVGDKIADELNSVKVRVNRIYADAYAARIIVEVNKDFHLYTGAYNIGGPDPTYLYYCFHSSMIPYSNYNSIWDWELDYWLEILINAATQQEAVVASHNAQQVFVNKSFKIPLWAYTGFKAMYRRYTGGTAGVPVVPDDGENIYRNITWQGAVNMAAWGIDNSFSFMNMHPTGFAYGHNENPMTIRYGFTPTQIGSLNPIYASWPKDWQILNLVYEGLIKRNPYNIVEWMPWMAKNFTVGTYIHPTLGNCTKVKFTLRTDVTWHNGVPLTIADVYFTLVELKRELEGLGLPPPWWIDKVQHILDFKIFDPYNFEVLFDVKTYQALSWIGDTPILQRQTWWPIIHTGDPTGFTPDPNLIGTGPWRVRDYKSYGYVDLVANKPGRTVQTSFPGSTPITSPYGYFQFYPVYADIHFKPPFEYMHKIPLGPKSVEYRVTLENLIREQMNIENTTTVDLTNPVGSEWHETWPIISVQYWLMDWIDNGDRVLSISDIIAIAPIWPPIEWYHVENMWWKPVDPISPARSGMWVLELKPVVIVNKYLVIDGLVEEPTNVYLKPEIPHEQQRVLWPSAGSHTIKVQAHIKEPNWDSWKLYCKWVNYTFTFWVTIQEDIAGAIHQGVIGPDIKVDLDDIILAALAFATVPGDKRWSPFADITGDYKIDIDDIILIALKFGWHG